MAAHIAPTPTAPAASATFTHHNPQLVPVRVLSDILPFTLTESDRRPSGGLYTQRSSRRGRSAEEADRVGGRCGQLRVS